jgi:hypothetical protein
MDAQSGPQPAKGLADEFLTVLLTESATKCRGRRNSKRYQNG